MYFPEFFEISLIFSKISQYQNRITWSHLFPTMKTNLASLIWVHFILFLVFTLVQIKNLSFPNCKTQPSRIIKYRYFSKSTNKAPHKYRLKIHKIPSTTYQLCTPKLSWAKFTFAAILFSPLLFGFCCCSLLNPKSSSAHYILLHWLAICSAP